MPMQVRSPVGQLVQGGFKLRQKKDDNDQAVFKDGQPVMETFIALAVPKNDPDWNRFHGELYNVARSECPGFFDQNGACTHPGFSWKIKDGDGRDSRGVDLSQKTGFAGCWIVCFSTQFMPACYHEGKFQAHEVMQSPDETIKPGDYIRVFARIAGNGVTMADKNRKPGIFVSQEIVSLVGYGTRINNGPDAAAAFGNAPVALPAGASATPVVGGAAPTGLAPPPMPGAAPAPAPAAPAPVYQAPAPAAAAPPPPPPAPPAPAPAGPTMTAKAMGSTREALIAIGWTDATLISEGLMIA